MGKKSITYGYLLLDQYNCHLCINFEEVLFGLRTQNERDSSESKREAAILSARQYDCITSKSTGAGQRYDMISKRGILNKFDPVSRELLAFVS
jgi:hypothetical protein